MFMIPHRHDAAALDRRGVAWGLVGVAVTLAITFVGSDGLLWFDAALIGYLFGIIFMVFGSSTATACGCAARRRRC